MRQCSLDAIVVKVRDGQVANRPVYVAIGVTWLESATSSGCGPATAERDMERAQVRFGGFGLLPEVFPPIGVSLFFKV